MIGNKKTYLKISLANIIIFVSMLLIPIVATASNDAKYKIDSLQNLINANRLKGDLHTVLSQIEQVKQIAQKTDDHYLNIVASSIVGQNYLINDQYDSAHIYLIKSLTLWNELKATQHKIDNYRPIFMIYNGLAILESNVYMDYEKATQYLIDGLSLARQVNNGKSDVVMGQNLVTIFFIRQNPAGLKYAIEIYEDGVSRNDRFVKYVGSYGCAAMYYLLKDYENAYRYANIARDNYDDGSHTINLYNIYAAIQAERGELAEAKQYYKKAMSLTGGASATEVTFLTLFYGRFLNRIGNHDQAIEVLDYGVEVAKAKKNRIFTYQIYEELSNVYSNIGQFDKALFYYTKHHQESSFIFNTQKERTINELTLKYETDKRASEAKEYRLELMKKSKELQLLIVFLVFVASAMILIYIMYRNKDRMYTRIASQYKEAMMNEKRMTEQINEQKLAASNNKQPTSLSTDKSLELFDLLEELIATKKIYRESYLTRDKVAEIMGTNRTYLSKIINDRTGKSFNQFINDYRIKESLMILSDPFDDTPLKAIAPNIGFSSQTTFYKLFAQKVGMTPAKYKEKIIMLHNSGS